MNTQNYTRYRNTHFVSSFGQWLRSSVDKSYPCTTSRTAIHSLFPKIALVSLILFSPVACKTKQQALQVSRLESATITVDSVAEMKAIVRWLDFSPDSTTVYDDKHHVRQSRITRVGRAEIQTTHKMSQEKHRIADIDSTFTVQRSWSFDMKQQIRELFQALTFFLVLFVAACIIFRRI